MAESSYSSDNTWIWSGSKKDSVISLNSTSYDVGENKLDDDEEEDSGDQSNSPAKPSEDRKRPLSLEGVV